MVRVLSIDTKSLDNILSKILRSESGIRQVILVDRTGLTIADVSKFSYFPANDGIGAISGAVFSATEEQGKSLDFGDLQIVTCEFSGGKIFSSGCGSEGVITIITDPDVNIGLIRLIFKKSGNKIEEILDRLYSDYDDTTNYRDPRDPDGGSEGALVNF